MLRFRLLGLSLFLLTPACGDPADSGSTGDDVISSGTEEDTTTAGSETAESSSDSSATGAEDTTTTGEDTTTTGGGADIPARGIAISRIEANQGVSTTIGQNDQWVPGNARNARLVSGRDTLIRVWHQVEPGWTERLIQARLTVYPPGQDPVVYTLNKVISESSIENRMDDDFFFGLVADQGETAPGTQYQVELFETEVGGGDGLTPQFNVNPATGPAEVGFESIDMEMNVMFIPFTYAAAGTTPDLQDPNNQKILVDQLYMQNPVQRVNAQFRDPVTYNGNFSDVCGMLSTVNQVWQQDGSPSNVYYTGLIDTGAQSGVVGCAWLNSNINMNLWRTNKTSTAETIVHEIGHDQGLSHVECQAADAAGPDPSYPDHPIGRTLNTGFGVRNFTLYPSESTFDYMSYCGPTWTSDWTWGRVWNRIQQYTAQGDNVELTPVLHHAIYPDGREEYWTSEARIDPERLSGTHEVEFVLNGEVLANSPSMVDTLSDGKTIWITTPLPEGGLEAEFDLVRDITAAGTTEVTADSIRFATPVNK